MSKKWEAGSGKREANRRSFLLSSSLLVSPFSLLASLSIAGAHAQAPERIPDKPELRWRFFQEQRAFPFAEIPRGALQAARVQMIRQWPALLRAPGVAGMAMADSTWVPIGPSNIPISISSAGRLTAIAVHPTIPDTIYIGAAQGGVWKTSNGGVSWVPLTDRECSLAMGALAIDPVNPQIVYAGTGEQHFSGDSYYGCGVLRSADGGATWTRLGAAEFDLVNGGAKISRISIDPVTAGFTTTTTLVVASDFGVFRSTTSGNAWTLVQAGTATDLVRDPTNPLILYTGIGGTSGFTNNVPAKGVYKSIDGGIGWTRMAVGWPTAGVGRINLAIAASAPATMFAAVQDTGLAAFGNLLGIFRTTNGGATWAQRTATTASCNPQCWYDMHIAVHPLVPDTVYFGGVSLYKSSDGGTSFATITNGIHVDQHIWAFDPATPTTVYAGNDGGLYRSLNGGAQWSSLNTNLAITQFYAGISLHPTDSNIVLGGTQDNGTLRFNGSATWDHPIGGDGGFTAINPLNPALAYGETQWSPPSTGGPRRSDNGTAGPFPLKVNGITVGERGIFIPPLVIDPVRPHTLYFGTFRIYRTRDHAESWMPISPDLTTGGGGASAIGVAASDSMVLYAGTSGGRVHVTTNGGTDWTLFTTGVPTRYITDIAVDPANAAVAWLTVSGFGTGHVFTTVNQGANWQDISGDLPNVPVNAIQLDPYTPGRMYVGTDLGVFRTSNGGVNWTPYNDGMPNVAVFDLAFNAQTGLLVAATHGRGMFKVSFDFGTANVAGGVTYYSDPSRNVPGAMLLASGGATGGDTTESAGSYTMTLARLRGSVTVTPRKTGDEGNAIGAFDASVVLRCTVLSLTCTSDQTVAGNVSADATLSALDASLILQKVVGLIDTFPRGTWAFSPNRRDYTPLDVSLTAQNFTGILLGDVTGNWTTTIPGSVFAAAPRAVIHRVSAAASTPKVTLGPRRVVGGTVVVPVIATLPDEDVFAFDADIGAALDLERILDVTTADSVTGFQVLWRLDGGNRVLRLAIAGATALRGGGTVAMIHLRPGRDDRLELRRARINETTVTSFGSSSPPGAGADSVPSAGPASFAVCCSQPNPFNATVGLRFRLDVPSAAASRVNVRVYDVRGNLVRGIAERGFDPGTHTLTWDGRDDGGDIVSSGVYLIVAQSGAGTSRLRVVFVR